MGKKYSKLKKHAQNPTAQERKEKKQMLADGTLPTKIDRSIDLYFRFLLGNPINTALLLDLLNSIFISMGYPRITKIRLRETEIAPSQKNLRHARLDILAEDENGRLLNLELQKGDDPLLDERLVLYNGRLYDLQTKRGKHLDEVCQTCSIALLAYNKYTAEEDAEQYIWDFMFRDRRTGKELTDKQWIILIEMQKVHIQAKKLLTVVKDDPSHELTWEERKVIWGAYFTNTQEGVELVNTLTQDPVFSQLPVLEEEYWNDVDHRYHQYRVQVEENARAARERKIRRDSIKQGDHNRAIETAKRMFSEHFPEETIVRISGLSMAEVEQIRNELS